MVLGTADGSEKRKCQADKAARIPKVHRLTQTRGDISDRHCECRSVTSSYAWNASLPNLLPSRCLSQRALLPLSNF